MTDERIQKLEKIMYVSDLTIEAKAIYAYLCSYEESDRHPFLNDILYDLNISNYRFYKHSNILIEKGYIERHQSKIDGKYGESFYKLK